MILWKKCNLLFSLFSPIMDYILPKASYSRRRFVVSDLSADGGFNKKTLNPSTYRCPTSPFVNEPLQYNSKPRKECIDKRYHMKNYIILKWVNLLIVTLQKKRGFTKPLVNTRNLFFFSTILHTETFFNSTF